MGLFSAAGECRAVLCSQELECLAQAEMSDQVGLEGIPELAKLCLQAFPNRPCHAVLSVRKFAEEFHEGLLPGATGFCLCRPQEAILAAALGGKPGVVIHSQGAFRALSVDHSGILTGLARDEGSSKWLLRRAQFWSKRFREKPPENWQELKEVLDLRPNGSVTSSLVGEAVAEMAELLHHLLHRGSFASPLSITWAGPEMPLAIKSALRQSMAFSKEELQWIDPVFQDPAMGCVLLAQASFALQPRRFVDDIVWTHLFR